MKKPRPLRLTKKRTKSYSFCVLDTDAQKRVQTRVGSDKGLDKNLTD